MRRRPFLLALLCLPLLTAVEVRPPVIPPLPPQPPPTIKLPPTEQPVVLERYTLVVQVRGLHAECTATMVFRNPNGRQLEGTLEFPLADQAAVSGYALDIGGAMVDGVIVGRDRARVALEAEQRQRVDPGIVEQVRGNMFRTRIFPVPPQGTRQIAVTWVEELAVRDDAAALRVPLPRCPLPTLELKVAIAAGAVQPVLGGFGNLTLTRWQDQHVAETRLTDVTPGDDLLVRLPDLPRTLVQVEDHEGERFVAITAAVPARILEKAAKPRRVAVAWDASMSRTPEGVARGLAALEALMVAWPGCVVDLVVFRDVPEAARACADVAALRAAIQAAPCDGGTALARLDLRRAALPHADDACWLVVSDGLGTLDEGLPACGDVTVHAILAETQRDAALLRLVAVRTGGVVVDGMTLDAPAVAAAIADPRPALLRVEAAAAVLADVQSATQGGRGVVTARLLGDGPVTLVFGLGGREQVRTTIDLKAASAVPGRLITRAWAAARAADLGVFPEANRAELIALGQRYHLVTPGTSLIVLETLQQYLRHRIEPPASLPTMRLQYLGMLKNQGDRWRDGDTGHLAQVVAWWEERVRWWQKPPVVAPQAKEEARPAAATAAVVRGGGFMRRDAINDVRERDEAAPAAAASETGGLSTIAIGGNATGMYGSRTGNGARRALKAGGVESEALPTGTIAITPFDPATPYLLAIKAVPADQAYAVYLRERESRRTSPSFFLDCAGAILAIDAALGRRVLSNLAELRLDDPGLLRVFAWRLQQAGDLDLAVAVLRRVLRLRPEEPQSYRDLALALAARGEAVGRGADLTEAMDLLHRVVMRRAGEGLDLGEPEVLAQAWSRFPQIEIIACEELNRLIAVAERRSWEKAPTLPALDTRLRQNLDCDLRVVMAWDADATDIDLHVLEPSGEQAYYGHRHTSSGGLVSNDLTQGYGPEEYLIRAAKPGAYRITCRYFGSRAQTLLGPATVTAMAITDWGRPNERRQMLTLRLDKTGDAVPVGTITVGGGMIPAEPGKAVTTTVTREQIRALKPGMDRAAVERALGAPTRVDGGGLTVLVYTTASGTTVRLGFGPELLWAREVLDGAERDLL